MRTLNRLMLVFFAGLSLAACGQSATSGPVTEDEMVMGNAKAKVTVIEYASASCSHCARFAIEVFPAFKTKYVDTGKVKYVFREFITSPPELAAAGFLTARCAGKGKYFSTLDGVFRSQEEIFRTGDMRTPLVRVAKSAGMTEEQFMACVSDEKALKALTDRVEKFGKAENITGTPTFIINGKKLDGEQSLATLDAAIAAAQAAAK
jgi:protein-disulfide isomerase